MLFCIFYLFIQYVIYLYIAHIFVHCIYMFVYCVYMLLQKRPDQSTFNILTSSEWEPISPYNCTNSTCSCSFWWASVSVALFISLFMICRSLMINHTDCLLTCLWPSLFIFEGICVNFLYIIWTRLDLLFFSW